MDLIIELGMQNIVDIIKIFYICIFTYFMNYKIINIKQDKKLVARILPIISMIFVAIICKFIKRIIGFSYNIIFENFFFTWNFYYF